MEASAEVRWFWPEADRDLTARATETFQGHGGLEPARVDTYLLDAALEGLGIKSRGSKPGLEVKALIGTAGAADTPTGLVLVELWRKWTVSGIDLAGSPTVSVRKERTRRKLDVGSGVPVEVDPDRLIPGPGCNVELTRLAIGTERWLTFALEAFAADCDAASRALRLSIPAAGIGDLSGAKVASYPAWLQSFARNTS